MVIGGLRHLANFGALPQPTPLGTVDRASVQDDEADADTLLLLCDIALVVDEECPLMT